MLDVSRTLIILILRFLSSSPCTVFTFRNHEDINSCWMTSRVERSSLHNLHPSRVQTRGLGEGLGDHLSLPLLSANWAADHRLGLWRSVFGCDDWVKQRKNFIGTFCLEVEQHNHAREHTTAYFTCTRRSLIHKPSASNPSAEGLQMPGDQAEQDCCS